MAAEDKVANPAQTPAATGKVKQRDCKSLICEKISAKLPMWRERVKKLLKEKGAFKVCDVTVEQIYGGIRGVVVNVSDISYVDPMEGLRIRGYTVSELLEKLPRAEGAEFPLLGGLYYLLLVDEIPGIDEAMLVEGEWKRRAEVPQYVYDIINAMPADTHPMTLFSQAILALQRDSVFAREYAEGILKPDYYMAYVEDSLNLTAKLPVIGAYIYNLKYRDGAPATPDQHLDWAANFAHMIGKGDDKEYQELARLFFILHSDHEAGNVSAHASALVASALSDVYYACSAGINGLAGPLHGLANQECVRWLLSVRSDLGGLPDKETLTRYLRSELESGRVIPGYGHAVLRIPDPRFIAQLEFGKKHLPDDELFQLVNLVHEVLPGILLEQGKVKNPFPNVDAINGTLQYHYGVQQFDFYTVLFGISRILGLTAHAVWSRALGKPIERPKSMTTQMLEDIAFEGSGGGE
jgi:citrate synthase